MLWGFAWELFSVEVFCPWLPAEGRLSIAAVPLPRLVPSWWSPNWVLDLPCHSRTHPDIMVTRHCYGPAQLGQFHRGSALHALLLLLDYAALQTCTYNCCPLTAKKANPPSKKPFSSPKASSEVLIHGASQALWKR